MAGAEGKVMTDAVQIGDREFRVGATYAPRNGAGWRVPAAFEGATPERMFVHYRVADARLKTSAANWLRWAGDEVTP